MRQSISTRYIGPTNFRGARIKAVSSSGLSLTFGWDQALDSDANHSKAAKARTHAGRLKMLRAVEA